ncbi:hypothetical protein SLA2020_056130 [Shorea laevis]
MRLSLTFVVLLSLLLFKFTTHAQSSIFDVTKCGAKANQNTDFSKALLSAWKEACAFTSSSKVVIPPGTYLLNPILLEGPCKAPVEIQVQGTIKAPIDLGIFKDPSWVTFSNIDHLTLSGGGVFDGQGTNVWGKNCNKNSFCSSLPINLRFNFITNAMVQDITSKDSKQFQVNVLGCNNFTFQRFKVIAPENSLNTDGIHIGRSTGINITDSSIATGDDCISLGDGSRNVHVTNVTCGPGHGISIGSLGKYENEEPVEGVFVKNCTLTNTQNGVRIKTWPASKQGSVTDLHFEDIFMQNVGNPILIDQEYCPWNQCDLQLPSRVKISKVSFKNIWGTTSTQVAVKLVCSKSLQCDSVELSDIDLKYNGSEGPAISQCSNVFPLLLGKQNPKACGSPVTSVNA